MVEPFTCWRSAQSQRQLLERSGSLTLLVPLLITRKQDQVVYLMWVHKIWTLTSHNHQENRSTVDQISKNKESEYLVKVIKVSLTIIFIQIINVINTTIYLISVYLPQCQWYKLFKRSLSLLKHILQSQTFCISLELREDKFNGIIVRTIDMRYEKFFRPSVCNHVIKNGYYSEYFYP